MRVMAPCLRRGKLCGFSALFTFTGGAQICSAQALPVFFPLAVALLGQATRAGELSGDEGEDQSLFVDLKMEFDCGFVKSVISGPQATTCQLRGGQEMNIDPSQAESI